MHCQFRLSEWHRANLESPFCMNVCFLDCDVTRKPKGQCEWTSYPVYAEQRAGLAEDADDLLDLAMAYPLADAAKHHQCPRLERWVVLKRKPGNQKCWSFKVTQTACRWRGNRSRGAVLLSELRPLVQPLAGWDVPHTRLEEGECRASTYCIQNTALN